MDNMDIVKQFSSISLFCDCSYKVLHGGKAFGLVIFERLTAFTRRPLRRKEDSYAVIPVILREGFTL